MAEASARGTSVAGVLLSFAPWRASPDARRLYSGFLLGGLGRQIIVVAVPFQLYSATGSSLAVGLLGFMQFLPMVLASIIGGALCDVRDRRSILIAAQVGLLATAVLLLVNASRSEPLLWPLFVLTAINAMLQAIDNPARSSSLPNLIGRAILPEGVAMMQTLTNISKSMGPLIAGVMLARLSLPATFAMTVVLFTSSTTMMWAMRAMPPAGDRRRVEWATIREGLDYVRKRPILRSNFVIDLNAMAFGMPTALFPAFGIEVLGGDATTVGLLYAAPGIGALLAALSSGWIGRVRRQGRAVVLVVMSWGGALAAFGLSRTLLLAVAFLVMAGASDVLSAIFRVTILQLAVPDEMRGRLFGINVAVVAGGPRLGDLRAGALADLTSVPFSIVSGGIACILGALTIARRNPAYTEHEWQNKVPERDDG